MYTEIMKDQINAPDKLTAPETNYKLRKTESIEMYLSTQYEFRLNKIKNYIEYRNFGESYKFLPIDKRKLNSLKRELDTVGIQIARDSLLQILESDFCPEVDPIKEYFESLPVWDRQDHIKNLCNTLCSNDNERFYRYFRKWLIAVIANALEPDGCKNHTCLVITGGQGKFKTTWIENLCPKSLKTYLYTGKINIDSKDTLTLLAEYLFINIDDQLSQINRKDENEIKNLITLNFVKYRKPYDPFITQYPRIASFVGSVNNREFLTDVTGSRRFLPFFVEEIFIDQALKINMDDVYTQAYHYYKTKEQYWFKDSEIAELYDYNESFRQKTFEEEFIQRYFKVPSMDCPATHRWTATDILQHLQSYTKKQLSEKRNGEALKKLGFVKFRARINNGQPQQVYDVVLIEGPELNNYGAI